MNIGEIARRAGVSRTTVSYALIGKRPVAAGNRLTSMQLDFVASVVEAAARSDLVVVLSPSEGITTVSSSGWSRRAAWTA